MILRAIYRNRNMAIEVPVHEMLTQFKFRSFRRVYDIRSRLKREGTRLTFDKFRPPKKDSLRGECNARDRETETEPKVLKKMNGSHRQQARSRFPELSAPAGGRGIAF